MLSLTGVTHVYANGTKALDNATLEIPKGMFGLLGPNGAGKSTLMRCIATLQTPSAGSIKFGDLDVLAQPEELRATATSLLVETGEKIPRPLVCARLLEHLEEWLSLHETEGFGPVRDRFRELSSTLGRKVSIAGEGAQLEGDAVDLDEDGALLVRPAGGAMVRVVAGDVEHCRIV